MMSSDLYFRDKISVAVLGATTLLGQQLVQLLARHPWFEIVALCDLEPFIDQPYEETIPSFLASSLPKSIVKMPILPCKPSFASSLIFSGLNFQEASAIEISFAQKGYFVLSHFPYPLNQNIPQIVANVNPNHLVLMEKQRFHPGGIVGTPQDLVIELSVALKPLLDQFGLETVSVVAWQPSSEGKAQMSDARSMDTHPSFFESLEARVKNESLKVLGKLQADEIQNADFKMSVQYAYQSDSTENLTDISIKLRNKADSDQIIHVWRQFASEHQRLQLPTALFHPLSYFNQLNDVPFHSQPLHDKKLGIRIANLCPCSIQDYKFTLIPSASETRIAESALLNAELLVAHGKIYW